MDFHARRIARECEEMMTNLQKTDALYQGKTILTELSDCFLYLEFYLISKMAS
jgi:hypothetical protein